MFLKTTIRENGIPFNLKLDLPNDVTAAIQEGHSIAIDESFPSYESIDDLKAALDIWHILLSLQVSLRKIWSWQRNSIISVLSQGYRLDARYRDHEFSGNLKGARERHIEPDRLLVYEIQHDVLVLVLNRWESHSEHFKK